MRRSSILGMALAVLLLQPGALRAGEPPPVDAGPTLTAMTINLYVGFDVDPVFSSPDFATFQARAAAAWANVVATDFNERADAIAELVGETAPDVIGLQEATLWLSGPLFNPAPATNVEYDYIEILLDALSEQGLNYALAEEVENLEFEVPVIGAGMDIGVVDRDAILVRTTPGESHMAVMGTAEGSFVTNVNFPFLGGMVTQPRGWVAVDVLHRGQAIRVVTTHLEAVAPPIRDAQAAELLAGPLSGDGAAILLADLNAESDGSAPSTYGLLTAAGFTDAWTDANGSAAGFTFGQEPELTAPSTLSERIDYVLYREGTQTSITTLGADVVGEEEDDRTVDGLWPSDHAAVVAQFQIRGDRP